MLSRSTLRIVGAASYGGVALVLGCGLAFLLAAASPDSFRLSGWHYVIAGSVLGAGVGATEAPRIASQEGRGALRVSVVASLAALVLLALVVATEAALGASGVVRSLTSAQEAFAGVVGAGLLCGSVVCVPVILLWGTVGSVAFRSALDRLVDL